MKYVYHEINVRQDLARDDTYLREKKRISECVESVVRDLAFQRSHVLVITAKLESVTTMVRDLVNLRNTYTTETLTARTVIEAQTMRVIALLTLCFLPPTFVAGFLDMGYIGITSERGALKFDLQPGLWFYLEISLPLVLVIIVTYLLWDRRNSRKVARQGSFV
ncbi:hypothetical protein CORC01_08466 [Colletotrichum orchidophilum]|uniref:Uncharacterized protein n=1 Tax=Colletotrichum orchidophilum TaxID=1209926 RepID=A0A1G4B487_9PEZI|nr:uncharacterized protein CORC01_08466 [Colletotrichum orchidophilum]OHE96248.1 hypothetical protein CORC01_08466 [Colletotrichum orchidophilum]